MLGCVAMFAGFIGCDTDSFLDPSEVGRYENTPVVLPILERLDVIDEPVEEIPGLSQIRSEDLIPEVREYVMGSGDLVTVTVFELITPGVETVQTRRVDELGFIRLPVIGELRIAGLTTKQLEQLIVDILDPDILRDPTVTVVVQEGRQRTFNILGVPGAGTYSIVQSNFRLLDAISLARGLPEGVEEIYIIRQVPLVAEVQQGFDPQAAPGSHIPPMRGSGVAPGQSTPTPAPAPGAGTGTPGTGTGAGDAGQPSAPSVLDPGSLIEDLTRGVDSTAPAQQPTGTPGEAPGSATPAQPRPAAPLNQAMETQGQAEGRFINVNGKWVWVESDGSAAPAPGTAGNGAPGAPGQPAANGAPAAPAPGELPPPEQLVTQRVIEIDAMALMQGDATQNIVVRPGDVIRVPVPTAGNLYIGGSGISRPGTYALPGNRKLTLKQLVISAGGLSPVGIPERVDLVRRLGRQQEAYVRLNYRAIAEGVQPDIFLKPDDTVTVGTNIFAAAAAVIRNGFRMSYGFGFLMDRNWGSDVFGVSPAEQFDN
jgi:polysaccharide export outer membrane protein